MIGQSAVAVREEWERKIELRLANGGASELIGQRVNRLTDIFQTRIPVSEGILELYIFCLAVIAPFPWFDPVSHSVLMW